jgi:RNA polymerase sigma-70 factor (ECF subfamily)
MALTEQSILQCLMSWRTRVSAAAWVVVHDAHTAEDIFQNVVVKALTREVCLETESALLSWAFITARREGIDWLRRHQRESVCLDEEILALLEHDWQSQSPQAAAAKVEALRDCLARMPEPANQLLRLRYFDGLSCEQVAEKMGIGLAAMYKRMSRLHVSLKECIEAKLGRAALSGAPST